MATIIEEIRRSPDQIKTVRTYASGKCPQQVTSGPTLFSIYETQSPVRPSRRTKPSNLLMSPTPYGPFTKDLYMATRVMWEGDYPVTCLGKSDTRHDQLYYSRDPTSGVAFLQPDVPPWEIDMRNKIKSYRVNLAESIGEWRETAKAVEGGAHSLRNAWRYVKRLSRMPRSRWPRELMHLWRNRRRLTPNDVPAAYLGVIFGVKPWVELGNEAKDALARRATKPIMKRFVVTKSATMQAETLSSQGGSAVCEAFQSHRATFYVRYRTDLGDFTPGNVAESMWAAVPLSFMVDWFLGVGEWLSAIDALEGVQSYSGTVTRRYRAFIRDERFFSGSSGKTPTLVNPGTALRMQYSRSVPSSIGLPMSVEWKNSASSGKLLSSLAILHQLRRSSTAF